jgi:hypothetical protein
MAMAILNFVFLLASLPSAVSAFSAENAQLSRGRLSEALLSPSGKLTLSPEIVVPEPENPTAILLQSSAVQQLSEQMRTRAKANTAWISGSVTALKYFCYEQEQSRGNFPGPVPVIYCNLVDDLAEVAEAGACGILVPVAAGKEVTSVDDLSADVAWVDICKSALECGLQPIPEVTIGDATAASWKEDDITALVDKLCELAGEDPVAVLLTVNAIKSDDESNDEADDEADDAEPPQMSLPAVPKELGRKIPVMGSVRVPALEDRFADEIKRFKAAGFTGALLRPDCVPGFPNIPDLNYVARFWSACIGDLKSTRSKNFEFRAKNNMGKDLSTQWANYQADVIDSGSLGDMSDSYTPDLENGDYKGF